MSDRPPRQQGMQGQPQLDNVYWRLDNLQTQVDDLRRRTEANADGGISRTIRIENLEKRADSVEEKADDLDKKYVRMERFKTVEMAVYGMIAMLVTAVLGAVYKLVLKA